MKTTQKNYNIFFILNSPYFIFGKILIKSIYKNCNTENVRKIYILDTGLSESEKKYLKSFDKVELLDSGLTTNFTNGSWSEDWHINIALKLTQSSDKARVNIWPRPICNSLSNRCPSIA